MPDEHSDQQPSTISSQADLAERRRISAQKYSALRDQLGLAFRAAQQEAHAVWSAWDEALGRAEEAPE